MSDMNMMAKILIIIGLVIIVFGFAILVLHKLPSLSFRFPGDILIRRKNFIFYFPLGLCILVSIILTIIFRIFR